VRQAEASAMGIQVKVSGDPRRPQEAVDFVAPKAAQDDESMGDIIFIVAMLAGVAGITLRIKLAAWTGMILCLSGIANMSSSQSDMKNMTMAIAFCGFGLVGSYMTPPVKAPATKS